MGKLSELPSFMDITKVKVLGLEDGCMVTVPIDKLARYIETINKDEVLALYDYIYDNTFQRPESGDFYAIDINDCRCDDILISDTKSLTFSFDNLIGADLEEWLNLRNQTDYSIYLFQRDNPNVFGIFTINSILSAPIGAADVSFDVSLIASNGNYSNDKEFSAYVLVGGMTSENVNIDSIGSGQELYYGYDNGSDKHLFYKLGDNSIVTPTLNPTDNTIYFTINSQAVNITSVGTGVEIYKGFNTAHEIKSLISSGSIQFLLDPSNSDNITARVIDTYFNTLIENWMDANLCNKITQLNCIPQAQIPPVARILYNGSSGNQNINITNSSAVTFDGSSSSDFDGTIDFYAWTIFNPEGVEITPAINDQQTISLDFNNIGNFSVILTVTNNSGLTHTQTNTYTTNADFNFVYRVQTTSDNQAVGTFNTNGNTLLVNYGDSTSISRARTSRTYASQGVYTVSVALSMADFISAIYLTPLIGIDFIPADARQFIFIQTSLNQVERENIIDLVDGLNDTQLPVPISYNYSSGGYGQKFLLIDNLTNINGSFSNINLTTNELSKVRSLEANGWHISYSKNNGNRTSKTYRNPLYANLADIFFINRELRDTNNTTNAVSSTAGGTVNIRLNIVLDLPNNQTGYDAEVTSLERIEIFYNSQWVLLHRFDYRTANLTSNIVTTLNGNQTISIPNSLPIGSYQIRFAIQGIYFPWFSNELTLNIS